MNPSEAAFEGQDLEETIAKACEDLGVEQDELDYRLDREHFLNGASTIRIFAEKKDPQNGEIQTQIAAFLAEEFEKRGTAAETRIKVSNQTAAVVIEADPGVVADDEEAIGALTAVITEVIGEALGSRTVEVSVRAPTRDEPRRRDRDDRRDRRGGRDRDDRRDRRGGRDRDDRRDRRGRRDRPDRDRRVEKDPKRDAELQERAKEAVEQVLEDGEPVTIDELNSYERRIIHRVVAEFAGVTTRSVGRGSLKAVEILEGEDEED